MQENQKKIDYVKPEILDLGPVTSVIGADCQVGTEPQPACTGGASPAWCVLGDSDSYYPT